MTKALVSMGISNCRRMASACARHVSASRTRVRRDGPVGPFGNGRVDGAVGQALNDAQTACAFGTPDKVRMHAVAPAGGQKRVAQGVLPYRADQVDGGAELGGLHGPGWRPLPPLAVAACRQCSVSPREGRRVWPRRMS